MNRSGSLAFRFDVPRFPFPAGFDLAASSPGKTVEVRPAVAFVVFSYLTSHGPCLDAWVHGCG